MLTFIKIEGTLKLPVSLLSTIITIRVSENYLVLHWIHYFILASCCATRYRSSSSQIIGVSLSLEYWWRFRLDQADLALCTIFNKIVQLNRYFK